MSAQSRSQGSQARRRRRTPAGKDMAFGAGLVLVLILGGFAGAALFVKLAEMSFLSSVVPDDGRGAVVAGGLVFGAVTGVFVPTLLVGMVHGTEGNPRIRPGAAVRKAVAVLAFDVYVAVLALVVSQLGRLLPERLTTLVGVFAIGLCWIPLALFPWERFGLGGVIGGRSKSGGKSSSNNEE